MVRIRKSTKAKAPLIIIELVAFSILWPNELEAAFINIIQYYIKERKLANNIFKKINYTAIIVEL
jgi:hypothetical protein